MSLADTVIAAIEFRLSRPEPRSFEFSEAEWRLILAALKQALPEWGGMVPRHPCQCPACDGKCDSLLPQ